MLPRVITGTPRPLIPNPTLSFLTNLAFTFETETLGSSYSHEAFACKTKTLDSLYSHDSN